ncbi:hypothetical protein SO694_00031218 [Aureococcus anophagefferens]|uniref:Amine oxidase domain-containing protein n=1 Tax=Aureococcus anophagefferens TaxID=44056 RepID=A0ABR1FJM7_AURAN
MAEWNRRREPDVHDVMTCRGILRCAATRDAPRARARAGAAAARAAAAGGGGAPHGRRRGPRRRWPRAPAAVSLGRRLGAGRCGSAASTRRRGSAPAAACAATTPAATSAPCALLRRARAVLRRGRSSADADLYHCDDGLLSRGALARTCERPQGWNGATGQWEHFAHADGNVAVLALTPRAQGRPTSSRSAPRPRSATSARATPSSSPCPATPRRGPWAGASRRAPRRFRAAAAFEGAGPRRAKRPRRRRAPRAGGRRRRRPRAGDAAPDDVAARARARAGPRARALGAGRWQGAPPDGPPPEPPFLDLGGGVFVCGDWCAGGGSIDRALVSGSSCARRVAELLSGEVDAPPS